MKILVTGGLGFIGSHTVVELQQAGYEVVIIDNCSNASESVLDGIEAITGKRPVFEKFDLRNREKNVGGKKKANKDKNRRYQGFDPKAPVSGRQSKKRKERKQSHSDNNTEDGIEAPAPVSV